MKLLDENIGCSDKFMFDIPKEYQNKGGIYKITNDKSKYIYIGRTKNFLNRYREHKNMFLINKNNCKFKYLRSCFLSIKFKMELIEVTNDIKQKELFYIKRYNSVKEGLNILTEDSDILDLYNKTIDPTLDDIFNDKELRKNNQKVKQLKDIRINSEVTTNRISSTINFNDPYIQKLLSENDLVTNGKSFYIRQDKLVKITKKRFLKLIHNKNILVY